MRKILALAIGLALIGAMGWAEPKGQKVSAGAVVTNTTLTRASRSLVAINDGPNAVFVRAFRSEETLVAAVATMPPSIEIKVGESFSFPTESGLTHFTRVSSICAAGQTASLRLVGE